MKFVSAAKSNGVKALASIGGVSDQTYTTLGLTTE